MSNAITTTKTSAIANLRTRGRSQQAQEPGCVLLCDTSGSMVATDTTDTRRRIDHLAEILSALLSQVRVQGVWTFDSYVREVTNNQLPEPSGSTALHLGLDEMAKLSPRPAKIIVICDGEVDQPTLAIEAAKRLGCPVDAYYVGPDHNRSALAFMQLLAKQTGGDSGKFNIAVQQKALTDKLVLRITHAKGA